MAQDPTGSRNPSQIMGGDQSALDQRAESALASYGDYVIPADQIATVWDAEDPQENVKALFLAWIEAEGERKETNLQKWDEYENRFQNAELNWISDFILQNMCHCKKIGIEKDQAIASLMHFLWSTLDILQEDPMMQSPDIGANMKNRYNKLQQGLKTMFQDKQLSKTQVQQTLEYARQSVFGHLQLYIQCIGMKKQKTEVKKIRVFHEQPRLHEQHGLEADCKEIQTDQPKIHEETNEAEGQEEEGAGEEEEAADEYFDPEDPLYGLEQRLEHLNLDDDSKKVIKEKLIDAHNKIKVQLEQRQANLEQKLTAAQGNKKK